MADAQRPRAPEPAWHPAPQPGPGQPVFIQVPVPDQRVPVKDPFMLAAGIAAVAGAAFALAFLGLGHNAIDRPDPSLAEARVGYAVALVAGLVGGTLGVLGAARRWPVSLAGTIPAAALVALWGATAAGSYATGDHCEGQPADNPELMGPFLFVMALVALTGGILFLVKAAGKPRDDGRAGSLSGVLLGPLAAGAAGAAAWHLANVSREAATARADWEAWKVVEASSCSSPGPGLLLLLAGLAVAALAWARLRR